MDDERMKEKLKQNLSKKRFEHSVNVSQTAVILAQKYGGNVEQAKLAGMLHDCARELPQEKLLQTAKLFDIVENDVEKSMVVLLHAPLGAKIAENEYDIRDKEILRAIALHTTGDAKMTLLDKIIYLADCIEPSREYPGLDNLRNLSVQDIDKAVLAALEHSLTYIISQHSLIHPATVAARNYLLQQGVSL